MRFDLRLRWLLPAALTVALGACGAPAEPPKIADAKPREAPAELLRLASMALEQGKAEEARKRYSRLAAIQPENVEVQLGLADSNLAMGDITAAKPIYDALIDKPQVGPRALVGQGLCALSLRQYAAAELSLVAAAEADPANWRAWNGLGQAYDGRGEWEKAQAAYAKAVAAAPDSAVPLNNQGYSYILQGKPDKAAKSFIEALRRAPTLGEAQGNLRLALAMQGRYEDAQSGAPTDRLPTVLNNVGYVAMSRGDYGHAEALLVRALETSPSYYDIASKNLLQLRNLKKDQAQ